MLTLLPVAMISGAKLVGVYPFQARSHLIVQKALMFELARRGHEVTVVSSFSKTSLTAGKGVAGGYNRP